MADTVPDGPRLGVEFTYRWYRAFLRHLTARGARFRTFGEPLEAGDVLLRHDVDLSVEDALRMARHEAELGVESTYFVLLTAPLYNPLEPDTRDAIREVEALGHQVGLHFSTHAYWPADEPPEPEPLVERVRAERETLARVADDPAPAVSFHVPPEWVLEREFEEFESAYAPAYFTDVGYRADSGQRWREASPLADGLPDPVQVLTHPGLWGGEDASFEARVRAAAAGACERADDHATRVYMEGAYSR